ISPDDQLQNIPFEALIINNKTNDYLIESSEVCYVYSMSFLERNKHIKRNATHNFIGYSPENFRYSSLDSLTQTTHEIKTIQNSIGGDIYCRQEASKESIHVSKNMTSVSDAAENANISAVEISDAATNLTGHTHKLKTEVDGFLDKFLAS
ncbi:MAG: CHAT domain-containing protein, partial [Rhizobiales bacterium]|nr:CHAT domain-containing protein [Hyphomicrobiales bacterium]